MKMTINDLCKWLRTTDGWYMDGPWIAKDVTPNKYSACPGSAWFKSQSIRLVARLYWDQRFG